MGQVASSQVDEDKAPVDVFAALHDYIEQERTRCLDVFKEFDRDQNGYLDKKEIREFCRRIAPNTTPSDEKLIKAMFDSDGDGYVTFKEFSDMWKECRRIGYDVRGPGIPTVVRDIIGRLSAFLQSNYSARQLFRKFDADRSGQLDPSEVIVLLRKLLPDITGQELRYVVANLHVVDRDQDGLVSFKELKSILGIKDDIERVMDEEGLPPKVLGSDAYGGGGGRSASPGAHARAERFLNEEEGEEGAESYLDLVARPESPTPQSDHPSHAPPPPWAEPEADFDLASYDEQQVVRIQSRARGRAARRDVQSRRAAPLDPPPSPPPVPPAEPEVGRGLGGGEEEAESYDLAEYDEGRVVQIQSRARGRAARRDVADRRARAGGAPLPPPDRPPPVADVGYQAHLLEDRPPLAGPSAREVALERQLEAAERERDAERAAHEAAERRRERAEAEAASASQQAAAAAGGGGETATPGGGGEWARGVGTDRFNMGNVANFLRAASARAEAKGGNDTEIRLAQEHVLQAVESVVSLAGHRERVEAFVGTLGRLQTALGQNGAHLTNQVLAGFDQLRQVLDEREHALVERIHVVQEQKMEAVQRQIERYERLGDEIVQCMRHADRTLLEKNPDEFMGMSEEFAATAGDLLETMRGDLVPASGEGLSLTFDLENIVEKTAFEIEFKEERAKMAALDLEVGSRGGVGSAAPEAGGGGGVDAETADRMRAHVQSLTDENARLLAKTQALSSDLAAAQGSGALGRTPSDYEAELEDLRAALGRARADGAEAVAAAEAEHELRIAELAEETNRRQADFEARLSAALEKSEAALMAEQGAFPGTGGGRRGGSPGRGSAPRPRTATQRGTKPGGGKGGGSVSFGAGTSPGAGGGNYRAGGGMKGAQFNAYQRPQSATSPSRARRGGASSRSDPSFRSGEARFGAPSGNHARLQALGSRMS